MQLLLHPHSPEQLLRGGQPFLGHYSHHLFQHGQPTVRAQSAKRTCWGVLNASVSRAHVGGSGVDVWAGGPLLGYPIRKLSEKPPPLRIMARAHLLHPDPSAVCVSRPILLTPPPIPCVCGCVRRLLGLWDNRLTGTIPSVLGALTKLTYGSSHGCRWSHAVHGCYFARLCFPDVVDWCFFFIYIDFIP